MCRTLPNQSPCDLCSTSPWGGVLCGAFGPLLQTTQSLCNQKESLVYTRGRLVPSQSWTSSLHDVLKIFCVELSDLVTSGDLALLALSSCTLLQAKMPTHGWEWSASPVLLVFFFFFYTNNGEVYGYQSIVVKIRENTSSRDELLWGPERSLKLRSWDFQVELRV